MYEITQPPIDDSNIIIAEKEDFKKWNVAGGNTILQYYTFTYQQSSGVVEKVANAKRSHKHKPQNEMMALYNPI